MHQFIKRFIRNCHTCKRFKSSRQRYQDWLRLLSSLERRWRDIFMNYVSSLILSIFMRITYRYVLMIIDRLFKMRHFVLIIFMKVEEAIDSFYQNVWKLHELLEVLVFDRDTQFIFDFWKLMYKRLKIDVKLFTSYHSEIDEQIERTNAIMKHYLRTYVNYMQNDWVKWLLDVEFASNNIDSLSILVSFFLVNFEQHSRMNFELAKSLSQNLIAQDRINLIAVNQFVNKMQNINIHLRNEMLMTQASYKAIANANRRFCSRYLVEDMTWLSTRNIQIARLTVKLNDRNIDLYRVSKIFLNFLIVQLELLDVVKIHSVFHVNLLQHDANDFLLEQRSKSRDLVIAEDEQRKWYVNDIQNFKLNKRFQSSLLKYLVNWEEHVVT
jgi:hypothetical protein